MSATIHSPLLYYGGKRWLIDDIMELVPSDIDMIVSPFIGGGAIELNLAVKGYKLRCYDLYKPLVNFWQHFLSDHERVILNAERKLLDFSHDALSELNKHAVIAQDGFEGASWYYVMNHLSYNGMAGISGYLRDYVISDDMKITFVEPHNRNVFPNQEMWKVLSDLDISVECSDVIESLSKHRDIFCYLDPPYPGNDANYCDGTTVFDHDALFSVLDSRDSWLLSYSNDEMIRDMYSDYKMYPVIRKTKHPEIELLILSKDVRMKPPAQMLLF